MVTSRRNEVWKAVPKNEKRTKTKQAEMCYGDILKYKFTKHVCFLLLILAIRSRSLYSLVKRNIL